MGSYRRKIWLPLVRLCPFALVIVLTGHFILPKFHNPRQDDRWVPEHRSLDFLSPELQQREPSQTQRRNVRIAAYMPPARTPKARLLLNPGMSGPSDLDFEPLPASLYVDWIEGSSLTGVERAANAVFSIPEALLDGLVGVVRGFQGPAPEGVVRLSEVETSLTSHLLDIEETRPSMARPASTFFHYLLKEEAEWIAGFKSTVANTPQFEYGYADADLDELSSEQGKILWDTVKATYLDKYRVRGDRNIRSHDLYFRRWRDEDWVVMPTLMAGYAWFRGLEKRISMGIVKLRVHLEPVRQFVSVMDQDRTRVGMIGLELSVASLPVRLIMSTGIYDGDTEVDFVGVGTRFEQIRQLLSFLNGEA